MNCDKCGEDVPLANDATYIQAIKIKNAASVLFCGARHFMPTETCEGSPSRAQYIKGQPRDTRYPYHYEDEAAWRAAYDQAQAETVKADYLLDFIKNRR